ncbi:MAG: histidine kinase dimerization/phosphoacceptor domain -containing protein [Sphingomonadaceae bacterium]
MTRPGPRAGSDRPVSPGPDAAGLPAEWLEPLAQLGRDALDGAARPTGGRFAAAPPGVRAAAALLLRLARRAAGGRSAMRRALHRDAALQRELHHRVRNNLQIVASHLAVGQVQVADPAAQRVLAAAQLRVSVRALAHRLLWDSADAHALSPRALVEAIAGLVGAQHAQTIPVAAMGTPAGSRMDLDTALPLALWLVEGLCLAMPADDGADTGGPEVALSATDGCWRLCISPVAPQPRPEVPARSMRLLDGHAAQLPGGRSRLVRDGAAARLELDFSLARGGTAG